MIEYAFEDFARLSFEADLINMQPAFDKFRLTVIH